MATYKTPGVYIQEIATLPPSVAEVSTAIPAFIGCTANGPTPAADGKIVPIVKRISTMLDYEMHYSGPQGAAYPNQFAVTTRPSADNANIKVLDQLSRTAPTYEYMLYDNLNLYFNNGGGPCYVVSIGNYSAAPDKSHFAAGLTALEKEDEPTLLLLTEAVGLGATDYYELCQKALTQCQTLRDRFTILDAVESTDTVGDFRSQIGNNHLLYGAAYYPYLDTTLTYAYQEKDVTIDLATGTTLASIKASNTALYSQIKTALSQQRIKLPPSPAIAGVYASVDRERGVWKAPANVSLASVIGPVTKITDAEQADLNIDPDAGKSINAIRAFTGKGTMVWGARTLAGNDNEWRYVSVRRLFILIEESTKKASAFAVFEPNDATTWLKVKAMIESYLYGLWQQGALAGPTPEAAYFVNVGLGKTMSADDILNGRLIVEIGIAAVRPAEFLILRFSHKLQQA